MSEKLVKFTVPSSKREFVLRVPTEAIVNQSLELAAPMHKAGQMREMSAAQGYQLRLCLVSVAGAPVRMDEIEGEALMGLIDIKEYGLLLKALEQMSTPSAEDVDGFLKSMTAA